MEFHLISMIRTGDLQIFTIPSTVCSELHSKGVGALTVSAAVVPLRMSLQNLISSLLGFIVALEEAKSNLVCHLSN